MSPPFNLTSAKSPFSQPANHSSELWQRLEARRPLPLRFVLHLSRRPNASLCPCIQVDLPSTVSPGRHFTVTRILDPEHRVSYITLTPLFLSSELSLIQGLLRFSLSPSDYDLSLAGLEPFDDFWISLPLARSIAAELDLLPSLTSILDPKTALAWSLDELGEGLSHNWRVPEDVVSAAGYSTDAILAEEAVFGGVQMLPRGQQIKTLVSGELRGRVVRKAQERRREERFVLHQRLVRWSSQLYAVWVDVRDVLEWKEEEEERRNQWRVLMEDLRGVSVPPTSVDVMEWMQLVSGPPSHCRPLTEALVEQEWDAEQRDETDLLQPLSLAELSELRSDAGLSTTLFPTSNMSTHGEELEATIERTRSVLRAKLATLHRMNVLFVPDLGFSHQNFNSPTKPSFSHRAPPQATATPKPLRGQSNAESAYKDSEVPILSSKIDQLSTKLDAFFEAQARPVPQRTPPAIDQKSQIASSDAVQPPADSTVAAQPAVSAVIDTHFNATPPAPTTTSLHSIETTPSLIVMFISLAIFFAMIQYQH